MMPWKLAGKRWWRMLTILVGGFIAYLGYEFVNFAQTPELRITDPAFLHYRSGALMMARARQLPGTTPAFDTLLGIVASREDPIAQGRHKVWGSRPLWVLPQTSTITDVRIKSDSLTLEHTKAGKWPVLNFDGTDGEGNPWVFVNRGGQWYAATYEWLRPGQTEKGITADTLPVEGSTITALMDKFSLTFSEDMLASTVNDPANYELRSAGPDGVFESSDDILLNVATAFNVPGFASGQSLRLRSVFTRQQHPITWDSSRCTGLPAFTGVTLDTSSCLHVYFGVQSDPAWSFWLPVRANPKPTLAAIVT